MADRSWSVEASGRRVNLLSRDPADPRDDRVLGSLPEKFRVVFDVEVVLRASGIPPEEWVGRIGAACAQTGAGGAAGVASGRTDKSGEPGDVGASRARDLTGGLVR